MVVVHRRLKCHDRLEWYEQKSIVASNLRVFRRFGENEARLSRLSRLSLRESA